MARTSTGEHKLRSERHRHCVVSASLLTSAAWWALALAVLFLVWRIRIGVGTWGDEPYALSTALRYSLGDRPLVDSWDTNFSSAVLALPFVRAFLAIWGSTDGILLAYRAVYVVMIVSVAVLSVRYLAANPENRTGLWIGPLFVIYMPFVGPGVGYGGDWILHILSGLIAYRLTQQRRERPWLHVLPGLVSSMAIIGNPPTITVIPFFVLCLWLAHRDSRQTHSSRIIAWYLAGVLTVAIAFLLVLLLLAGPSVLSLLPHVLEPDDHSFGLGSQAARVWSARWLIVCVILVTATLRVLAVRRRRPGSQSRAALAILMSLLGTGALAVVDRLSVNVLPQSIVFAAGASILAAFSLERHEPPKGTAVLIAPAAGAAFGWFAGSNGGIFTAIIGAPLLLAAGVLWAIDLDRDLTDGVGHLGRSLIALALGVLVVATGAIGVLRTPEGTTLSMQTVVSEGPFAGIRGTEDEARLQSELVAALRSLPAAGGRVVFLERFALGYLITLDMPGTYSTWATSASSDRLQQYIDATGNRPARIVLTRYALDLNDGEFPETVNIRGFEEGYSLIYADQNLRVFDLQAP